MPGSLAIGIDLGATKIAAALVDAEGQVLASRQASTLPAEGLEAVLGRIAEGADALAAIAAGPLAGVGIGTPGQVDPVEGIVRNAVNLGWDEVRLAAEVRLRLERDLPVWVEKDTNAGALGEHFFGAARGCPDFVYLTVGSGLGGGVMVRGALVSGADFNASELGHLSLDPDGGRRCACGMRGCAETVVSGPGLVSVTREMLARSSAQSRRVDSAALTTRAVSDAARAGDPLALGAFAEVARGYLTMSESGFRFDRSDA